MSVINYTPNSNICKYNYNKLKNVVYLVDETHVKNIHIDNGEAYIDGLTELPLRLNGFNVNFDEESSLDERYRFRKTIRLSMKGYVNSLIFPNKYYVILESTDGTFWMVNVDFPSRVTYTFNLAQNVYQTDFTFSSLSNFPTLKLHTEFEAVEPECMGFNIYGIQSLKLLEREFCALDTANKKVYTYGKDFQTIEFLGDSCQLTEEFDGIRTTTTIDFNIAFDNYQPSWHYNLLEFLENLYGAIIVPKGGDNTFFAGFNTGLQPSFTINSESQTTNTDIITVTLREMSDRGLSAEVDWDDEDWDITKWVYKKWIDTIKCYECISRGTAIFLVQQEVLPNGTPTGNYRVKEGYEDYYRNQGLNVVGTFSVEQEFGTTECSGTTCGVITNVPLTITYTSETCYTYNYSASCDWNVSQLPSHITVNPISGSGGSQYTLTVCNTKTPITSEQSAFNIASGDNVRVVNVVLTPQSDGLRPESISINCLEQNAIFTFNSNCPVTVTSYDQRVTYQITNSQLIVNVPRNNSVVNSIDYAISVVDCNNRPQTVHIYQDKTYERWVDTEGYICVSADSYTVQERYTGTTASNINVRTGERRAGTLIQSGDTRCSSTKTRWRFDGNYYCVDGNKYEAEEQEITYDNVNWVKTGKTRLGQLVEISSSFCSESVDYEWRITTEWQCDNV